MNPGKSENFLTSSFTYLKKLLEKAMRLYTALWLTKKGQKLSLLYNEESGITRNFYLILSDLKTNKLRLLVSKHG